MPIIIALALIATVNSEPYQEFSKTVTEWQNINLCQKRLARQENMTLAMRWRHLALLS